MTESFCSSSFSPCFHLVNKAKTSAQFSRSNASKKVTFAPDTRTKNFHLPANIDKILTCLVALKVLMQLDYQVSGTKFLQHCNAKCFCSSFLTSQCRHLTDYWFSWLVLVCQFKQRARVFAS